MIVEPSTRTSRCGNTGTTGFGILFGRRFQTCVRPYGDEETERVCVWWWKSGSEEEGSVVFVDPRALAHATREVLGSMERRLMVVRRVVLVDSRDFEVQVRDFAWALRCLRIARSERRPYLFAF